MTESKRSERDDFEALVRRHQAQVCGVAYARLRDRGRSEEVAQDAFLIAWRDRSSSPPSVAWICGIARNLARNAARRRTETPMTDEPAATTRDARDELITREATARANAVLSRLPERYREAIVLYYGGEESIADVASALGISQEAARQRVHRGRTRLRGLLAAVETTLRATQPTAAFTAACVAAWTVGKATPTHAASMRMTPLAPVIGAGVLVVAASVAVVVGVAHGHHDSSSTLATQLRNDPRAGLKRRFAPSSQPVSTRSLPPNALALGPATMPSTAPAMAPKLVELDFSNAPFMDLIALLRNEIEAPIWVAYETDQVIDVIQTHGKRPVLEVFDQILDKAGASRTEVAAIKIVADGRTDATALGGEPVTLNFRNAPLNAVLGALEPKLGMPIGRLGTEVLRGSVDDDGQPEVDRSPPITIDVHDVSAGAALEQVLIQADVGYELTTGFVILPR